MATTDTLHEEGEARASWKTERKSQKKHLSYDSRLSMTFAAIAAMTVMVLVIVLATVWEGEFQQYARSNMEAIAQAAATTLGERYEE
ncbi:MAG: sensor histidine kinase, partial [Atopobiaceae bacterium]|nr:sensor histidine kinase [Atopobiaceae bacterium]